MGITNWSIRHSITVLVLMVIFVVAGLGAYNSLPREAQPDVTIPFVMVSVPYIGVSPADIETLITNELEEEFEKLKDVEEMRSTSAEGVSLVMIEFKAGVDMDTALSNVRERVDLAKPDLPDDAEDPIISEISFSDFPIMNITMSGPVGLVEIKRIAELLEDDINRLKGILDVRIIGGLEREIRVEADPQLLEYYNVSFNELIMAVRNENMNIPGGTIDVGEQTYLVRIPGEFKSVREIEDVVVRQEDGEAVFVRDVARVVDGFEDVSSYSRLDDVQAVSVIVTRRAGENIIRITDELKALVAHYEASYGESVSFTVLDDVSDQIRDQLSELENNILTGLLLVLGVLMIFLGNWKRALLMIVGTTVAIVAIVMGFGAIGIAVNPWLLLVIALIIGVFFDKDGSLRTALFVGTAIPFSMLISFAVLGILGITLNIVVLFSLVLALGMLVDNAIVIVENVYRHMTLGKGRVQATMDAVEEVAWPIIAATATTVGAFLPLMFWPGIMGEFMKFLPLTVMIVLTASLFVALVINPVLCALLMKVDPDLIGSADDDGMDEVRNIPNNALYNGYRRLLEAATQSAVGITVTIVGSFAMLILSFVIFANFNAGVEFFPETTPERIKIDVILPDGSNVDASDRMVRQIEGWLVGKEGIAHVAAATGSGVGQEAMGGSGSGTAHQSRISIEFNDDFDTRPQVDGFILNLRAYLDTLAGARFEIQREESGPPTGAPINLELMGVDYGILQDLATQAQQIVGNVDGIVDLKMDFETGRQELAIRVDRREAGMLGVSTFDIANTVRAAVNGTEASVFREHDDEFDIIVRLPEEYRRSLEDVSTLYIKTPSGARVQIREIASFDVQEGYGAIRHLDSNRVVTIASDVAEGYNDNAVLMEAQRAIAENLQLPPGYQASWTGQNKEQEAAGEFLSTALLSAMFIIALILITQFNSLLQPGIILFSVVLSLIGVLMMLVLRQAPFVMIMTGVGIISLAGVVVNNAIVLVDYMNQLRDRGMAIKEAVVVAGLVRFRPVLLTAITTMLSLLPTVLGISFDAKSFTVVTGGKSVEMWGPMANAVVGGLFVSTVLVLVVIPSMYVAIEGFSAWLKKVMPASDDGASRSPGAPDGGATAAAFDVFGTDEPDLATAGVPSSFRGTQPVTPISARRAELDDAERNEANTDGGPTR